MKRINRSFRYFSALVVVYALLIFLLPANTIARQQYDLSATQYHVLLFLVALPPIAVWFFAFYGYSAMMAYTKLIKKTAEGTHFQSISHGLGWITWGLPVTSVVSLTVNTIANSNHHFHPMALAIVNYVNLFVILIAFNLIHNGSRSLALQAKLRLGIRGTKLLILFYVFFTVVFCLFVFRSFNLHNLTDARNNYFMPTWLAVTTLLIPYLYAWLVGLLAAYEILILARHTSGILYRKGLQSLVFGIVIIIGTSTALQYYRSIVPRTGHLSLGVTLIVSNIIQLGTAIGFLLLAFGARRLKRIEEV